VIHHQSSPFEVEGILALQDRGFSNRSCHNRNHFKNSRCKDSTNLRNFQEKDNNSYLYLTAYLLCLYEQTLIIMCCSSMKRGMWIT
jgi:hypothetical protein